MISALDPGDGRTVEMWVAGPATLLVAKVHKIAERVDANDRVEDKDALDVLRLLRAVATSDLAIRLQGLRAHDTSRTVTAEAVEMLPQLFGAPDAAGVAMMIREVGAAEPADILEASLVALVHDLLGALG